MPDKEKDRAGKQDHFDAELKTLISSTIALLRAKDVREQLRSQEIRDRAKTHWFLREELGKFVIGVVLAFAAVTAFFLTVHERYTDMKFKYEEAKFKFQEAKLETLAETSRRAEAEAETATWRTKQLESESKLKIAEAYSQLAEAENELKGVKVQRDLYLSEIDESAKEHGDTLAAVEKEYQENIQSKELELRQESADKNKLAKEIQDLKKRLKAATEVRESLEERIKDIEQKLSCGQDSIEFVVWKTGGLRDRLPQDLREADAAKKRQACWKAKDVENHGSPVWITPQGPYVLACYCG